MLCPFHQHAEPRINSTVSGPAIRNGRKYVCVLDRNWDGTEEAYYIIFSYLRIMLDGAVWDMECTAGEGEGSSNLSLHLQDACLAAPSGHRRSIPWT